MKLIPRRKQQPPEPTTFERAAGYAKLAGHGLTAQRVARKGVRRYRFLKRLAVLTGLAAIAAAVAKKLRGGGAPSTPSYSGGSTAGTGAGASAGTSAAAAATAATETPPATNGAGAAGPEASDASSASPPADASGTDETLEVEAPNQSTPPPPEATKP